MNRHKRLLEIRRRLDQEPSVQRRWVWECREKILEYLIARYGAESSDSDPSGSYSTEDPDVGVSPDPHTPGGIPRFETCGQSCGAVRRPPHIESPAEVRLILEDIARRNERKIGTGAYFLN